MKTVQTTQLARCISRWHGSQNASCNSSDSWPQDNILLHTAGPRSAQRHDCRQVVLGNAAKWCVWFRHHCAVLCSNQVAQSVAINGACFSSSDPHPISSIIL